MLNQLYRFKTSKTVYSQNIKVLNRFANRIKSTFLNKCMSTIYIINEYTSLETGDLDTRDANSYGQMVFARGSGVLCSAEIQTMDKILRKPCLRQKQKISISDKIGFPPFPGNRIFFKIVLKT